MISRDGHWLVATRGLRGFLDGLMAVTIASHFEALGYSGARTGILLTSMLLGSAVMTLATGFYATGFSQRRTLLLASLLMAGTGLVYATSTSFWLLLLVGFLGTLNPTSGDVSVFQPIEQALLPNAVNLADRSRLFARYTFIGTFCAALGFLSSGLPTQLHLRLGDAFFFYAAGGVAMFFLYSRLGDEIEPKGGRTRQPLRESRTIVLRLSALFSIDSFGGGFTTQALVALWLFRRFHFTLAHAGLVLSMMSVLSAASSFIAVRIEPRLGAIRTMVFTHVPAQLFLIATALMPNASLAVLCLLARSLLASMDVPVRNAYVMSVVTERERPAAASMTNVPRSMAAAMPPFIAGWMLDHSTFGWPLIASGCLKLVYDLLLLRMFGEPRPREPGAG